MLDESIPVIGLHSPGLPSVRGRVNTALTLNGGIFGVCGPVGTAEWDK